MNQIFSASRFGAYFTKSFSEQSRNMLLRLALITGLLAFIMATNHNRLDFFTNTAICFIFSCVWASRFSDYFNTRSRKITFLLTPASQFEKFLSAVVHTFIIVPTLYAVALLCAQYIATLLIAIFSLSSPEWTVPFSVFEIDADLLVTFCISYFTSMAYYILGATIWSRNSFLKATAITFAIGIIFTLLFSTAIASLAIQKIIISSARELSLIEHAGSIGWNVLCATSLIFMIVYLVIAYIRITEFEVNETKH